MPTPRTESSASEAFKKPSYFKYQTPLCTPYKGVSDVKVYNRWVSAVTKELSAQNIPQNQWASVVILCGLLDGEALNWAVGLVKIFSRRRNLTIPDVPWDVFVATMGTKHVKSLYDSGLERNMYRERDLKQERLKSRFATFKQNGESIKVFVKRFKGFYNSIIDIQGSWVIEFITKLDPEPQMVASRFRGYRKFETFLEKFLEAWETHTFSNSK